MGRSLLVTWVLLVALATAAPLRAQRPPPIVSEFEEGPEAGPAEEPAEAEVPPPRPLPPIVSDFDGPMDEDEPADPLMPTPDDEEPGEGSAEDDGLGVADESDEDAGLARRLLQHSLLVERRRDMASRLAASPNARLLASPFRDQASSSAASRSASTVVDHARLPRAIDRLELGGASANAPVTSIGIHDDGLRMRVGVGLDAFREPSGFRVRFEPMVALATDGTL